MDNCSISEVSWQASHQELSLIRIAVFMYEQQVSATDEWDGKDEQAAHFLVRTEAGEPIATARILTESNNNGRQYHIGRVAVLKAYRGQGIGHRLMRTLINWCRTKDPHEQIYLHAQVERQTFYEKLGFIAQGAEFIDAGIAHITMNYDTGLDHEHSLDSP